MPLNSQVPSQSPQVTRPTSAAACSPCCHLATDTEVSTATATGRRAALSQALKQLCSCSTFQLQIVFSFLFFFMPLWQSRLQAFCLWVSHPSVPLMLTRQFRSTLMEILPIQYQPSLRVYDALITFCWPEVEVYCRFYIFPTLVKKKSQKYLLNWLYVCNLAQQLNSEIQVIHLVNV